MPSESVAVLLGQRVAALRKRADAKQEGLATDAGTTASTISRLEHGKAVPDVKVLDRIATALGVTIADLFTFGPQKRQTRRRTAFARLAYMLRGRTDLDVEAVLAIVIRIFEIKRRGEGRKVGQRRRGKRSGSRHRYGARSG